MSTGRNKSRDTKPNKQGSRSKSTTKKVVDAVKRGIKNQPIVKGLTNVRNKARSSIRRSLDKKSNNTFTKLEAGADTKRKAAEKRKKREFINKTEKAIARGTDKGDYFGRAYREPPSVRPNTRPPIKSTSLRPKARPESLRPKIRPTKKSATGGRLKAVPEGNKGLKKLPTAVRNKMGFMKDGGQVSLLSDQHPDIFKKPSGQARGMGAASRGGKFSRDG